MPYVEPATEAEPESAYPSRRLHHGGTNVLKADHLARMIERRAKFAGLEGYLVMRETWVVRTRTSEMRVTTA
ncbi:hypothetical protein GCM10007863_34140 [Dyella mobilis]|nr:hypothetical protein GCM10007863_34140 [Dyella mobilis]